MSPAFQRLPPILGWLGTTVALAGVDQGSKAYFANTIFQGEAIEITSWFNLVHILNSGAAFSLFAGWGGDQIPWLIGFSGLVVVVVSAYCLAGKVRPSERWLGALIVAGGLGNLVDRIQTGAVVDFLDLHWRGWHWPAFNLADVFIVVAAFGALLLSWHQARTQKTSWKGFA